MPAFSHWSDEQLNNYLHTAVIPLVGGREAREQELGSLLGGFLNQLLGLLELQDRHGLLTCEAQQLAEAVFRSYVRKHAPDVEQQAIRYRARVAKEAAIEAARRGEALRIESERLAAKEKARIAQIAADEAKRHRDAVARNLAAEAELAATRAREDAAFVEAQSK